MRCIPFPYRLLSLAGLSVLLLLGAVTAAEEDKDFTPLFNGKDMSGFKLIGVKDDTFQVKEGVIVCTGKPNGYFATEKAYKNYHLKFEVRYARPKDLTNDADFKGNSGVLIHITGEHKVWPKCVEAQGMNRDMGNLFSIGGAPKGSFKKDAEAQKKAIKPVGEWNLYEVISKDGELVAKINGVEVSSGKSDLTEGPIGWQSEGAEIHFKNIRIKELK